MATYLHPGVYVEEIPSGVKPIEGVSTSTAAFIGYTTKGPIGEAQLIFKWDSYEFDYGGIRDTGTAAQGDSMGYAVSAFFQNGGTNAYIVRLATGAGKATGVVRDPADSTDVLELSAVNEGKWADGLIARLTAKESDPSLYTVEIGRLDDRGKLDVLEAFYDVSLDSTSARYIESAVNDVSQYMTVTVAVDNNGIAEVDNLSGTSTSGDLATASLDLTALVASDRELKLELDGVDVTIELPAQDFTGDLAALATAIQTLVIATGASGFTAASANDQLTLTSGTTGIHSWVMVDGSHGVAPTLLLGTTNGGTEAFGLNGQEGELAAGADGTAPAAGDYDDVFSAFEKIRDISIVCLPGQPWSASGNTVVDNAIDHAEAMKSRMVLVDPPADTELVSEKNVTDLGLPTSTYTVLYYPWVKVANPFYDEDTAPGVPATVLVSPSGYAAGMWSKIDGKRGVWKAPAGVETRLLGLSSLQYTVEDAEQDQLNPLGVNALRNLPIYGSVIWGARTLSTKADPEWRYVPVRRTAIFIEQSIYNGIQWAVFEPNDHRLWSSLRVNIESFMDGLFRSGAFQGEKASDAYFVRCGLGDTMEQGDIDRGQVIVIVGFAPLKPAEFVIVRIQQKVAEQ